MGMTQGVSRIMGLAPFTIGGLITYRWATAAPSQTPFTTHRSDWMPGKDNRTGHFNDGTDTLTNIQMLRFADQDFFVGSPIDPPPTSTQGLLWQGLSLEKSCASQWG